MIICTIRLIALALVCWPLIGAAQHQSELPTFEEGITVGNHKFAKQRLGQIYGLYIKGVGDGLQWGDMMAKFSGTNIYCPPPKIGLNSDNYSAVIDSELKAEKYEPTTPIAMVLALGLRRTFPCSN